MSSREEEDAWREIVEHYGERAQLPEPADDPSPSTPTTPTTPLPPRLEATAYDDAADRSLLDPSADDRTDDRADAVGGDRREVPAEEDGFVPPPAPPVPRPKGPRLLAWLGVLGVPVLLVVAMLLTAVLPSSITALLVVWFLGGFLYLVSQMPRERDDPWDDGAVL